MAMVIRVRFKRAAKLYDFDPNGLDLHNGMSVVTETARGVELGECMSGDYGYAGRAPGSAAQADHPHRHRAGSCNAEAQRTGGKGSV